MSRARGEAGERGSAASALAQRFSPYQKRLLVFLSVATFFEGYDFIALAQVLPRLRAEMRLDEGDVGLLVTVVGLGTVVAYALVRKADRWGRRRVLTITIAGYTTLTFLSGLAPNLWVFAIAQLGARVFLIGEWATSMVIAAEEFPAARRGTVIGVIQGCSSLGAITCAATAPYIMNAPWGWRTVYFVGVLPLVALAYARRNLKETRRFEARGKSAPRPLGYVFGTPYRRRVLELGAIWMAAYVGSHSAVTFWKDFAVNERALSDAQAGHSIAIAAVVSMPFVFAAGRLLDAIGRRTGAVVILGIGALGTFGCYTLHGQTALTVALVLGVFGASAWPHVLNAFTTELFPTDVRGDAFAWANNLIGRIGYVVSPLLLGLAATAGGWGPVLRLTALATLLAILLILIFLPETRARELEETAALR